MCKLAMVEFVDHFMSHVPSAISHSKLASNSKSSPLITFVYLPLF